MNYALILEGFMMGIVSAETMARMVANGTHATFVLLAA